MSMRSRNPWLFVGNGPGDVFTDMMDAVMEHGFLSSPRGQETVELLHCVTRFDEPQQRVLTIYGRRWNPFFAMAETVWILLGQSEAKWITQFNSRLKQVLDPGSDYFHGAYGERIRQSGKSSRFNALSCPDLAPAPRDQLVDCFYALKDSPESRQAVITLWNPAFDHPKVQSLDRPCNIAVTFKVRHDRLHMSVFNRSNDAIYGLSSTNAVQFSTIQEVLARWLGVNVGAYTHYSDSLHVYLKDPFEPTKAPPGTGLRHRLRLYDYVYPLPMSNETPAELEEDLWKIWNVSTLPPKDPYWASVHSALLALDEHRYQRRVSQLDHQPSFDGMFYHIHAMRTIDWGIECLRWLAERWATEPQFWFYVRGALTHWASMGAIHEPGEALPEIWKYIFQSAPHVPIPWREEWEQAVRGDA